MEDDESDEDWGRRPSQKRKKKRKKAAAKPAKAPKPPKQPKPAPLPGELTATGRRRRKDAGQKKAAPRRWTEAEEAAFVEGLARFGRDWRRIGEHLGTRDARAVSSHAQKHFIRLCLQGKRLPPKVRESGEGYTLSGKPLDPNSAAARAYGFKPNSVQLLAEAGFGDLPGLRAAAEGEAGPGGAGEDENRNPAPEARAGPGAAGGKGGAEARQPLTGEPPTAAPSTAGPRRETGPAAPAPHRIGIAKPKRPAARPVLDEVEPTEYAKSRPRRDKAGAQAATFLDRTSESLELQAPGAYAAQQQPFAVAVAPEALLLMDLHAHLSRFEVIGYLGGTWDRERRAIAVERAFPCRGAAGSHGTDSCEMDPVAEVEVKAEMERLGLSVVGWYHSHPTFAPLPSVKVRGRRPPLFRCRRNRASGLTERTRRRTWRTSATTRRCSATRPRRSSPCSASSWGRTTSACPSPSRASRPSTSTAAARCASGSPPRPWRAPRARPRARPATRRACAGRWPR